VVPILCALLVAASPATAELLGIERQTLVIAPLRALGVSKQETSILTDEIRTQAVRADRYTVVAPEEMKAINEEMERQLAGGCDEASCVAEIGGALGAHLLITGTLGKLGKRYTINLKLIDIEKLRAVRTGNLRAERIEDLVGQLGDTVFALLGVAVKNRVTAGRGELEIHFSGVKSAPPGGVGVFFDQEPIGESKGLSVVKAQVPAGEGSLTLMTLAKVVELLPPSNYPDAVIGLAAEGFIVQVPSRERLRLTAVLAHSQAWMSPRMIAEKRMKDRAFRRGAGKISMAAGAALSVVSAVSIYQYNQPGNNSSAWLVPSILGGVTGVPSGIVGVFFERDNRPEPWWQAPQTKAEKRARGRAKRRLVGKRLMYTAAALGVVSAVSIYQYNQADNKESSAWIGPSILGVVTGVPFGVAGLAVLLSNRPAPRQAPQPKGKTTQTSESSARPKNKDPADDQLMPGRNNLQGRGAGR
jgi:TolB-like protein